MLPKFTLLEGYASYHKSRAEYKRRSSELGEMGKEVIKMELPYVESYNEEPVESLAKHLGSLDYSRLEHLLQGNFYNPYVMKLFSRLLLAIYRKETVPGLKVEAIHHWLKKVETLSAGVNGITLEATLFGMNSPDVVVKYAKEGSLIPEIFIGLFGTNRLRSVIPNFSFVYGGFPCSSPYILDDRLLTYCTKDVSQEKTKSYYALYENAAPAISLRSLLPLLTPKEFLDLYFQTILALEFAYEQIGYTHFDLHPDNLLIRELEEEVLLLYPLDKGRYYIRTRYIPTIIDYGNSSITYKGIAYFIPAIPLSLGLGEVSSFPLYDAFRILAISYLLEKEKSRLSSLLGDLMGFFTEERGPSLDKYLSKTYQALPTSYSKYSLQPLIDFLFQLRPSSLVTPEETKRIPRFFCRNNCKDVATVERELYLTREGKANSLFQLYFLLSTTGNRSYIQSYPPFRIQGEERKLVKKAGDYLLRLENIREFPLVNLENSSTQANFIYYLIYIADLNRSYKELTLSGRILLYLSEYIKVDKDKARELLQLPSVDLPSTLDRLLRGLKSYRKEHPLETITNSYIDEVTRFLTILGE